ncbi:MAG TPA: CDP-alcohol phosphatidyltransferase family protein [Candidatus Dormibacteraeota bacterium]|nr:CDP-alcohol phosphatidyltransferase family protein [Candidatus Dormibacteraeota bacterium]
MRLDRTGIIAGAVYVMVGALWTWAAGESPWVLAWLVAVAVVGAFIPGEANQVSLARAYLAAPAFAYALTGQFGLLAVTVAVAGLTDLVDGTVARRFAHPTHFGGGLDPVVDGLFTGALCIGLALGGALPLWLALVVIARYLLPALGGGLLILLGRRPELHHTLTGQVSTVLILVLVGGVCLLRGLHQDANALLIGAEVAIPLATLATFVHLAWASRRTVAVPGPG